MTNTSMENRNQPVNVQIKPKKAEYSNKSKCWFIYDLHVSPLICTFILKGGQLCQRMDHK